jgi:quercetin dioxygenase-like cupin family protein
MNQVVKASLSEAESNAGLSEAQVRARHVKRADMVAERVAFIDCKMPGSHLKENYSLIGPGVTQSKQQKVSIAEPHGFSLGVAAMPAGITNNLHIHYTAEVFMIYKGKWVFRWGANGDDGEIVGEAGDVVSIPTWIFRGFSNIGDSDGWIFTALGGDDTGGIIWHPRILQVAAEHGLYLTKDNMMVDTALGHARPSAEQLIEPLDTATVNSFRKYSVDEMLKHVVKADARAWSAQGLLDSGLPGHGAKVAPVLGHGISQDRDQSPPVTNPHGFSIDWVQIPEGGSVGRHRLPQKQIMIVFSGSVEVTLDSVDGEVSSVVAAQDVFSFPAQAWRSMRAVGDGKAEFVLMTAGDEKKKLEWSDEIVRQSAAINRALDHNGSVADLHLLPVKVQAKFA